MVLATGVGFSMDSVMSSLMLAIVLILVINLIWI